MNLIDLPKLGVRYDPDRSISSPDGTMMAIFTARLGVKKPKILRICLVDANDFTRIGYITFCKAKHNIRFRHWCSAGYIGGRVENMEERGQALADRFFAIAKALKL